MKTANYLKLSSSVTPKTIHELNKMTITDASLWSVILLPVV